MVPLFTNQTTAGVSSSFTVTSTASITVDDLEFEEYIRVEVEASTPDQWKQLTYNTPVFLSKVKNTEVLVAPGMYRLAKGLTTNPVSAGYTLAS